MSTAVVVPIQFLVSHVRSVWTMVVSSRRYAQDQDFRTKAEDLRFRIVVEVARIHGNGREKDLSSFKGFHRLPEKSIPLYQQLLELSKEKA